MRGWALPNISDSISLLLPNSFMKIAFNLENELKNCRRDIRHTLHVCGHLEENCFVEMTRVKWLSILDFS